MKVEVLHGAKPSRVFHENVNPSTIPNGLYIDEDGNIVYWLMGSPLFLILGKRTIHPPGPIRWPIRPVAAGTRVVIEA